ncbi:MAG: hypothetical protein RJA36_1464 [Pseudomonadota bacterium]|jgi:hypothetical protein
MEKFRRVEPTPMDLLRSAMSMVIDYMLKDPTLPANVVFSLKQLKEPGFISDQMMHIQIVTSWLTEAQKNIGRY